MKNFPGHVRANVCIKGKDSLSYFQGNGHFIDFLLVIVYLTGWMA